MTDFETKQVPASRDAVAPDGSDVRILLGMRGGGMAHFQLGPDQASTAVTHRTVEEIWYFLSVAVRCGANKASEARSLMSMPGLA